MEGKETLPKLTMKKNNYAIKNLKEQLKNGVLAVTGSIISSLTGESQPIIPNSDHEDESAATGSLSSHSETEVIASKKTTAPIGGRPKGSTNAATKELCCNIELATQ